MTAKSENSLVITYLCGDNCEDVRQGFTEAMLRWSAATRVTLFCKKSKKSHSRSCYDATTNYPVERSHARLSDIAV